jgi:hypothetical protein
MICNINYTNPFFTIEKVSRQKRKRYGFVGSIDSKIKTILDKLTSKTNITSLEKKNLEELYGSTAKGWYDLKSNTTFNYIEDKIHMNDTLHSLKLKLYYHIDNDIPVNQQVWFNTITKKYRVIGTIYETITNVPIITQYTKKLIRNKDDYVVIKDGKLKKKKLKIINENNFILYDLVDNITDDYIIYVANLKDEVEYLISKKIKIKKEIEYVYLNKFWVKGKISDSKNIKNKQEIHNKVKYDISVNKFLEKTVVNKNNFSNCNMVQCYLHINWDNEVESDLLKIYNKLRDNLSETIPFIKYKHDTWDVPYVSIYAPDKKRITTIDIDVLKSWIYTDYRKSKDIQDIKFNKNSIVIKVHSYTYNDTPKYFSITLDKYCRMQVIISYIREYESTVDDFVNILSKCKDIIKNINEILTHKLKYPSITTNNSNIILSDNIEISRMYTTIKYNKSIKITLNDLYNLANIFPQYIIPRKDTKKINTFTVKYIKISNFENMGDIFETIQILFNEKISEVDIINQLEKQFNINTHIATNYIKEWKKKIGIYETKKTLAKKSGISILIENEYIKITNIKNFREIHDVYNFILKFITIYSNYNHLKSNKNLKLIIKDSDKYIKNINNSLNNVSQINSNYMNNINNIFNNSFSQSINSFSMNNMSMNNNNNIKTVQDKFLANDADIESTLLMTCDDPIYHLDVCTDICDDPNYILRRLQRYDNKLFKFSGKSKSGKKIDNYSRKCGRSGDRQPIVLNYNPDENLDINRNSYTYACKYRSNPDMAFRWYICPRVWDAYEEKPVAYDQVTDIKVKRIKGTKICKIGVGPYGNKVLINSSDDFTRKDTKWERGFYPGFLDKNRHPDKLCMPCCFESHQLKKPKYKDCMGEEIDDKVHGMEYYIFNLEKIPLDNGRFGILSPNIGNIFGIYKKEHGYLKEGEQSFLRRGIIQDKHKSFIYVLAQIYCETLKIKFETIESDTVKLLLNAIENILKENTDLFNSLNHGLLKRVFDINRNTPVDNFIKYLKNNDEDIKLNFVWDLFQRPGVISKAGINIIIFSSIEIICPYDSDLFYQRDRPTIFLIKHDDYYEPIYFVKYEHNKIIKTCIFENNNITNKFIDIIDEKCNKYYNIDWKLVLKNDNLLNNKVNELKQQYNIKKIIQELNKLGNKYHIKYQIMDHYYKIILLQLNNDMIIPVQPTSNLLKYKLIDYYDINLDKLLSYKDMVKEYNFIKSNTSLKYEIVYKLLDVKKQFIVNLVTNTGVVIPIKRSPLVKDTINIKDETYYYNADKGINNQIELPDARIILINKYNFEKECYQRLRLLTSKKIKDNNKIQKYITEIKNKNIKLNDKRDAISTFLYKHVKDYIHVDTKDINLENYKVPINRFLCNKKKCGKIHCHQVKKDCKLRIMKKNIITGHENTKLYFNNIAEELLRNPFKGDEIMNDKVPILLDTKYILPHANEILLDTKEKLLTIDKYYYKKEIYHMDIKNNINYLQFKELNFNTKIYKKHSNNDYKEYQDIELSSHWKKILNDQYKSMKYRQFKSNTLQLALSSILQNDILDKININDVNINSMSTTLNINILILENRISKDNRHGYVLHNAKSNKYIVIYKYKINMNTFYSPIVINKSIKVFTNLPTNLMKYIENTAKSTNSAKSAKSAKSTNSAKSAKSTNSVNTRNTVNSPTTSRRSKIKVKIRK